MALRTTSLITALAASLTLAACGGGGREANEREVVEQITGGANPYLWRASLDTMKALPIKSADPFGGLIIYDWRSFADAPDERIKATVYILDTRLRADGVNVSVSLQKLQDGEWVDAETDPDTEYQLENAILERARNLKAAEIG
ncbi:MAG: DUF3576 domain-containing protein [Pseudomonadota bacterium]